MNMCNLIDRLDSLLPDTFCLKLVVYFEKKIPFSIFEADGFVQKKASRRRAPRCRGTVYYNTVRGHVNNNTGYCTVLYSTVKITGFKILFANISPLSPSVLYPVSCGAHSRFQREETTAWGARVRVRARAAWACRGRDGATAAPGGGEQKEHLPGTMRV